MFTILEDRECPMLPYSFPYVLNDHILVSGEEPLNLEWRGLHSVAKVQEWIKIYASDPRWSELKALLANPTPRTSCKLTFPDNMLADMSKRAKIQYKKGCEDLIMYEVWKRTWPELYCSSGAGCKQCAD